MEKPSTYRDKIQKFVEFIIKILIFVKLLKDLFF